MSEIDDLRGRREDIYSEIEAYEDAARDSGEDASDCDEVRALREELDDIEGRLERLGEKL